MTDTLAVWLGEERIGRLARTRNGARFSFEEDVVDIRPGSPLLSASMPVRPGRFDAAATDAWFTGLLPEDARLDEVRRFYGLGGEGYFDVLAEIGWECAGAVRVLAEDGSAPRPAPSTLLDASELARRLAALPSHPFDAPSTMRFSLGGFQEKLCVIAREAASTRAGCIRLVDVALSGGLEPTTHILKPQPIRFPGLAQAEAWGMTAAGAVTPAARVTLLDLDGEDAPETLVVERFDRKPTAGGGVIRLHQEDCCQALGIPTERKYAAEASPKKSDPTFAGIAQVLMSYAEDPVRELETLFRQMVVNVSLGNTDAHGKNYALVHEGDLVRLAPLYDVVPAREITPGVSAMGMRIDGRIRIDRIGAEQLVAEGVSWGLRRERAAALLADSLDRLVVGIERAEELYPQAAERHAAPALERIAMLSGRPAQRSLVPSQKAKPPTRPPRMSSRRK